MTLAAVRPFARLIADWCLEQDDLVGFRIEVYSTEVTTARLEVTLDWPNGCRFWRAFSLLELEFLRDPRAIVGILESFAAEARNRTARIADPNRLPG